jgi:hypothetical protein
LPAIGGLHASPLRTPATASAWRADIPPPYLEASLAKPSAIEPES